MNRRMKIGIKLLASIGVVIMLTACHENINKELLAADEYLNREQVDSAYYILKYINPEELDGNEDMALYALLYTKVKYIKDIPIKNDSIDIAVFFYDEHGPINRLADAYNYKGITLYTYKGKSKEAITCLKKAEALAIKIDDKKLKQKIDENICIVNLYKEHYKESLVYGIKALKYAQDLNNKLCIAYDYSYISNAYAGLENADSALKYELKILPYLRYFYKSDQGILLSNLSSLYFGKGDIEKAKYYLHKALHLSPTVYSYAVATNLYLKKGKVAMATTIMEKAPLPTNNIEKHKKYSTLYELYKKSGNIARALDMADSLITLSQQVQNIKNHDNLSEIQAKYDREIEAQKYESRLIYLACTLVLLIFLSFLLIYRQRNKYTKTKQMMMQNQLVKNDYIKKIADMEKSQGAYTDEIADMREKIKSLEGKVAEETSMGKICYDHVLMNGSIAKWKDNDFNDFIDYYRLIDISYVVSLEEGYRKLTPYQTFFMILDNKMNKNEAQLEQILGISYSSIRSMKSRINLKRNTSISSKG